MSQIIQPVTPRLHLRQWAERDLSAFAGMCADPEVMRFFPGTLERSESDLMARTCEQLIAERGWGIWAVELLESGALIGIAGLHIPRHDLPFSPCVEVLWRLARPYWGNGYATEAAEASLQVGFEQLELEEIVSFAVLENRRSRAVMERIGMTDTGRDFDHPALPETSLLRRHCLYSLSRRDWSKNCERLD
ncbi:GNAT family N-acetyltransferase [Alloalcanivorax gelatiniphagus]|uniref:GNAT family N-acetyltransferase n=1 Tax=Alloalcanivorax gelatiniphagus TaxID=1194167 RepID=A0ABY2XKI1_9GAMM|nr:GNAT family N-acetyltransferase [Alloalcanivorax gelatiniphagus]TMW11939.1 GNAT family N-acetyltransferase [Alloalcanivorax gelatiniphagus]